MAETSSEVLLPVRVGRVLFALPTARTDGIGPPPSKVAALPGADAGAPGVFQHGGHAVALIDLRARLGLPADRSLGRVVFATAGGERVAFQVDEVLGLVRHDELQPAPLPPEVPRRNVTASGMLGGRIVLCTDPERLMTLEPVEGLRRLAAPESAPKEPASGREHLGFDQALSRAAASLRQPEPPKPPEPKVPAQTPAEPPPPTAAAPRPAPEAKPGASPLAGAPAAPSPTVKTTPPPRAPTAAPKPPLPERRAPTTTFRTDTPPPRTTDNAGVTRGLPPRHAPAASARPSAPPEPHPRTTAPDRPPINPPPMRTPPAASTPASPPVASDAPRSFTPAPAPAASDAPTSHRSLWLTLLAAASVLAAIAFGLRAWIVPTQASPAPAVSARGPEAGIVPPPEAAPPKRRLEFVVEASRAHAQEGVVVHTVSEGDTLWGIAERYIHDPWAYRELAAHSGIDNPDLIHPGEEVRIVFVAGKPRPE